MITRSLLIKLYTPPLPAIPQDASVARSACRRSSAMLRSRRILHHADSCASRRSVECFSLERHHARRAPPHERRTDKTLHRQPPARTPLRRRATGCPAGAGRRWGPGSGAARRARRSCSIVDTTTSATGADAAGLRRVAKGADVARKTYSGAGPAGANGEGE